MEEDFFNKDFTYAVVGASNNRAKYGFQVLNDLKIAGFKVIPINPHESEILGLKCYPSISSVPEKIDVVITVVKPSVTEKIVEECSRLSINKVWMQPGSESKKAIDFCKTHGINVVYNTCIMVERNNFNLNFSLNN
jgi:predicted CoA-binding protein